MEQNEHFYKISIKLTNYEEISNPICHKKIVKIIYNKSITNKGGTMKIIKKTIMLADKVDKTKPQMILELENKNNMVFGCIRSFNPKYTNNLVLGIKNGAKIIKQNVALVDKKCQFKLSEPIDLGDDIHCALVDTSKDFEPVLWGSTKSTPSKSQINSLKESIQKLSNITRSQEANKQSAFVSHKIEASQSDYENPNYLPKSDVAMASVSVAIDDLDSTELPPQANLFETSEKELDEEINKEMKKHEFYNMISDQIDELFARYPREKNLEALVENSEWCKIDSDMEGRYYVVGIIKQDNDIKYICYGVPGSYDVEPPQELRGYSQWLPTDPQNPYTEGFWVMYQDSDTGENIRLG